MFYECCTSFSNSVVHTCSPCWQFRWTTWRYVECISMHKNVIKAYDTFYLKLNFEHFYYSYWLRPATNPYKWKSDCIIKFWRLSCHLPMSSWLQTGGTSVQNMWCICTGGMETQVSSYLHVWVEYNNIWMVDYGRRIYCSTYDTCSGFYVIMTSPFKGAPAQKLYYCA